MRRTFGALLALLGLSAPATGASDTDPVVLTVGTTSLPASEVTRRLSLVPSYQLRTLGATPVEIRRRFVDTVLAPELLLAAEAERRGLKDAPGVRERLQVALQRALVAAVQADVAATPIPDAEVRAYYEAHPDDFHSPERLRLWRILLDDESLARTLLREAAGVGGPERWSRFAREHSVDAATKMRSGLLGFVFPDGRTEVPQVQTDPALYAAASKVKDGQLVPEPVSEGGRFAVVWRRGTLREVTRSFDAERETIRVLLQRQRTQAAIDALRETLRRGVTENTAPLETQSKDAPPPPLRAHPTPVPTSSSSPAPRPTERGLR